MFREQHTLTHEDWRPLALLHSLLSLPEMTDSSRRVEPSLDSALRLPSDTGGLRVCLWCKGPFPWVQLVLCGWDVTLQ